ncbi:MAG: MotA/TolQ/ExbB proton channel family protein [Candidatus Cloacimonetes bacterium]|jgi:biopolymer transport protein ExbB|nr:MotA/TolQ/ExbB proton channel family protein [Candidatus Cloacimonadota bacterium]
MYVLGLISIAAIAIIIEKYMQFHKAKKANALLMDRITDCKDKSEAQEMLNDIDQNAPLSSLLSQLLSIESHDLDLINQSMESAATVELSKLERGVTWLSTFSAVGPLIGFLGTVIGMVRVFMSIESQSGGGVDISLLAGGIWEAMLTTVGGLVVGIITIIFYNDLVQKLEVLVNEMSDAGNQMIARFKGKDEA